MALLTIAVPTYNRADCLELLLRALVLELEGLANDVQVVVADNASTDRTPELIAEFAKAWPAVTVVRQPVNRGPDENFLSCVEAAQSTYFWLIGDDDLPKAGVIAKLLQVLREQKPDLVSLGSEWVPVIKGASQGKAVRSLEPHAVDRLEFARQVNVWMTFISGMVINRDVFIALHPLPSIRQWMGTYLIQMGWIFPVLAAGERFVVLRETCVLATAGNTGGYRLMTVFGVNFPRIARSILGEKSPEAQAIIQRTLLGFLPGLAWNAKRGTIGNFLKEDAWSELRTSLGQYPIFWLVLYPIMRGPRPIALLWYVGVRILVKVRRWIGFH